MIKSARFLHLGGPVTDSTVALTVGEYFVSSLARDVTEGQSKTANTNGSKVQKSNVIAFPSKTVRAFRMAAAA